MHKSIVLLAGLAIASAAVTAQAVPLVSNGNFETTTNGPDRQMGFNTDATGWSTTGYNFIFAPGSADTTGATSQFGNLQLWGPGNGSANGLPASSPAGGNYVAADGAFQTQPISQTINGLTPGNKYIVGFWYGFGQQYSFDGATIQNWSVSLGADTQTTADYDLPNHGFSGWMHKDFTFTATSVSEVLSFLAYGNLPVPPFALLDGVTLDVAAIPEPAAWAVMVVGIAGIAGIARRRRAKG
jgi:hypothetical protein